MQVIFDLKKLYEIVVSKLDMKIICYSFTKTFTITIVLVIIFCQLSLAHQGQTDSRGCHRGSSGRIHCHPRFKLEDIQTIKERG